MKFLEKYGFDNDEIKEALDNTPQKLQDQINKHLELVEENLKFIQNLGIDIKHKIILGRGHNNKNGLGVNELGDEFIIDTYKNSITSEKIDNGLVK